MKCKSWDSDILKCKVYNDYPVDVGYYMETERGNLYMPNYTSDGFCYKNTQAGEDEVAYIPEQSAENFDMLMSEALKTGRSFDDLFETKYRKRDLADIVKGNPETLNIMLGSLSYEDPYTWFEEYQRDMAEE